MKIKKDLCETVDERDLRKNEKNRGNSMRSFAVLTLCTILAVVMSLGIKIFTGNSGSVYAASSKKTVTPLGTDTVTGYNMSLRTEQLLFCFSQGISAAMVVCLSQNLGHGDKGRARRFYRLSTLHGDCGAENVPGGIAFWFTLPDDNSGNNNAV